MPRESKALRWSALTVLIAVLALARDTGRAASRTQWNKKTVLDCALPGLRLELLTEESCGNRTCGYGKRYRVLLTGKPVPLASVERTGDAAEADQLQVRCTDRALVVSLVGYPPLRLLYDAKGRRLLLPRRMQQTVDRLWSRSRIGDAERRQVGQLAQVLSHLDMPGVRRPLHALNLLAARHALRRGNWALAANMIESSPGDPSHQAALRARLATLRQQSQPIEIAFARRIGYLIAPPRLPPYQRPTLFWQKARLCAVQEETAVGPTPMMRCYAVQSARWGRPEPARFPPPRQVSCGPRGPGYYRDCCRSTAPLFSREPPDDSGCIFFPDEVLAVAPGPAVIETQADGDLLHLALRTAKALQRIDAARASAVVRLSSGSRLLHGARYLISPGGMLAEIPRVGHTWQLLDKQVSIVLASPDQRWIAGLSLEQVRARSRYQLQVFRTRVRRKARAPAEGGRRGH